MPALEAVSLLSLCNNRNNRKHLLELAPSLIFFRFSSVAAVSDRSGEACEDTWVGVVSMSRDR